MENQKAYNAFISYSQLDREYAKAIQHSIQTLGLPFYKRWKHDVTLFRDQRKIPLTHDLTQEIRTGLASSQYLLVIASKNSGDSKWVKEEILEWQRLNHDKDGFITNFNFILIDNVVEWDEERKDFDKIKTKALPKFDQPLFRELPAWTNIQNYCKSNKINTSNENYEWEIARVKAWLLNKRPDEIIDDVSFGKRVFRIILIAGIVVFGILAGVAVAQKLAADEATARAEESRKEAEDNLTSFKIEEFERNLRNGAIYFDAQEYCLAKEVLMKADSTLIDPKYSTQPKIELSKNTLKQMLATCYANCKN
jgi:hypothetical protein